MTEPERGIADMAGMVAAARRTTRVSKLKSAEELAEKVRE